MKKHSLIFLTLVTLLSSCNTAAFIENKSVSSYTFNTGLFGDSKFINNHIFTTYNDSLTLVKDDYSLLNYDISASWIDGLYLNNTYYIIAGNWNKEINLIKLDDKFNLIEETNLMVSLDSLLIDPALIYFNNQFYFTFTAVEGNVNNSSTEEENGLYTIKLFSTSDFKKINYERTLMSEKHNLEDIELFVYHDNLGYVYEEEVLNRGDSSICLTYSDKELFDTNITLVSGNDNEPAKLLLNNNKYYFFYSSDKANPHTSYAGSDIYYLEYDNNFNFIKEEKINSSSSGLHLLDVNYKNNQLEMVSSINYDTARNLFIESVK